MYYIDQEERPRLFGTANVIVAILLHIALFGFFYFFTIIHFQNDEKLIPLDLTLVVNENLDGKEDEPPPTQKIEEKPEPPKPVVKEPEPPPREDVKAEAVEKIPEKKIEKKPEVKKPEIKKEEVKKPEEPKPTKEELRKKRLEDMRKNAVKVNDKVKIQVKDAPHGDGRTERKTLSDAEIKRLLGMGYRPGTKEQLAPNEMSRCISLVQRAIEQKWEMMQPEVGQSGYVSISVRFDMAGRMSVMGLAASSGDRMSDNAAMSVARSVGHVSGLGPDFLRQFSREPLTIRYRVRGM